MKDKISFIFFFITINAFSQGVNNLWLMGYQSWAGQPYGGTNLDFSSGSLSISYENRIMNFSSCNGVISDGNGNFLFSSNGVFVANASNDTMLNGSGLNPGLYTSSHDSSGLSIPQGNLILPFPDDSMKYFLFHETVDDYGVSNSAFFLYYSVIDMSLDNGRGEVIQKNQILFSDTLICGRISACKHANGRDWWLVCHKTYSNRYFKFLITPFGFIGPYIQDMGSYRDIAFSQCAFSPDGKFYAFYEASLNDLDIMSFDRCTGDFSNLIHIDINDSAIASGVAFSPNSQLLYVSSQNYIYQFDLTAANVQSSMTTVATYDGYYSPNPPFATLFYLAQLASDGKIYVICANSTVDIHVINNPNSLGLACNVCQHCIHLPSFNSFTIPNFPNYYLGTDTGTVCDSLTSIEREVTVVDHTLKVYPNPLTSEEITFEFPSLKNGGELIIYDSYGQQIYKTTLSIGNSTVKFKTPFSYSGVYIALLKSFGNGVSSIPLIFNK